MNKLKTTENYSSRSVVAMPSAPSPEPQRLDIEKFIGLVTTGVKSWVDAGKLLIAMSLQDEKVFNKIIAKCEWLTLDTLMTFCRIGRMELRPEVLLLPHSISVKMLRLGYTQQSKILDTRVPVVIDPGDAEKKPLVQQKRATELTGKDLDQIINGSKVLTVNEQCSRIRAKRNEKHKDEAAPIISPVLEPEKKKLFLGCYRLLYRNGQLSVTKIPSIPLNAQRILLSEHMGDTDAFIELTKWD